jgi:hypothetical protein
VVIDVAERPARGSLYDAAIGGGARRGIADCEVVSSAFGRAGQHSTIAGDVDPPSG